MWYALVEEEQLGPMDSGEVEELYSQGVVTSETLVWKDGFEDWLPLGQTTDFAHLQADSGATVALDFNAMFGADGGGGQEEEDGTLMLDAGDNPALQAAIANLFDEEPGDASGAPKKNPPKKDATKGKAESKSTDTAKASAAKSKPSAKEPAPKKTPPAASGAGKKPAPPPLPPPLPGGGSPSIPMRGEAVKSSPGASADMGEAPAPSGSSGTPKPGSAIDFGGTAENPPLPSPPPEPATASDGLLDPFAELSQTSMPTPDIESAVASGEPPGPLVRPSSGGGGSKARTIALAITLVLGGGGAGALYLMGQKDDAPKPPAPTKTTVKAKSAPAKPVVQATPTPPKPAVPVPPLDAALKAPADAAPAVVPDAAPTAAAAPVEKGGSEDTKKPPKVRPPGADTPKLELPKTDEDRPPARVEKPKVADEDRPLDRPKKPTVKPKPTPKPAPKPTPKPTPKPPAAKPPAASNLPRTLSKAQLLSVLAANSDSLKPCLAKDESLKGRLFITVRINSDGKVKSARLANARWRSSAGGKCIQNAVKSYKFPPFSGDRMEPTLPITLK